MSIQQDDIATTGPSDDDAVAALVAKMAPPPTKPSTAPKPASQYPDDEDEEDDEEIYDEDEGEDEEELSDEDDDSDEPSDDDEEGEDEEAEPAAKTVDDDAVVSVVVNGEEQQFTVASLKRLAGQEAALTRKSQEADTVGQRAAAVLTGALETITEDLASYKEVDWILESKRMDPEEFQWHRENYTKLQQRYQKVVGEAQNLDQVLSARRQAALEAEAAEAIKVLSDPNTGIPGWSDTVYDEIRSFAVSAGLPADDVDQIVNPAVIKIINDARLYHEAKKATAKKVNLSPTKVRKTPGTETLPSGNDMALKKLEKKLHSGQASDDDAIALLTGRWGARGR